MRQGFDLLDLPVLVLPIFPGYLEKRMQGPAASPLPSGIIMANRGAHIRHTNYFESSYARTGLCFLSWHDHVARLLVPPCHLPAMSQVQLAHAVAITCGRLEGIPDCLEVMFEDDTDCPYSIQLLPHQYDSLAPGCECREINLHVYTRPDVIVHLHGVYREAERLPYLKAVSTQI